MTKLQNAAIYVAQKTGISYGDAYRLVRRACARVVNRGGMGAEGGAFVSPITGAAITPTQTYFTAKIGVPGAVEEPAPEEVEYVSPTTEFPETFPGAITAAGQIIIPLDTAEPKRAPLAEEVEAKDEAYSAMLRESRERERVLIRMLEERKRQPVAPTPAEVMPMQAMLAREQARRKQLEKELPAVEKEKPGFPWWTLAIVPFVI